MAKGNLFQGMARGKVGDVVFYRMNGVQMSRVRNRAPKNPRSNEQLYQRSIIASVMKLYSAGKEIFDHSFQGYTVGEGCMRRFNSVNARILRAQIVSDINEEKSTALCVGRVVGPRVTSCTPINYVQISEGTLDQNLVVFTKKSRPDDEMTTYSWKINLVGNSEDATVNQVLTEKGIYAGDIFTFCICSVDTNTSVFELQGAKNDAMRQFETHFDWVRFIVKSNINNTLKANQAKLSDVFDIEQNGQYMTINADNLVTDVDVIEPIAGHDIATMGVIRSRLDVDLRSTSVMYPIMTTLWGLTSNYIIDAWADMVQKIGTSELILEGGEEFDAVTANIIGENNTPIIPANVDEAPVRRTARHKGSINEKEG